MTQKADYGRLVRENRRLREATRLLLDELEAAQGGPSDLSDVRDALPDPPGKGSDEGISPPWERDGYETKQAWMADRGGAGDG